MRQAALLLMKKLAILLFLFLYIPATLFPAPQAFAQQNITNAPIVTLSDAIYADIAVRGDLDHVSIVYDDGKSVDSININSDRHWLPASTVKTFAAIYAFKEIDKGDLKLTDNVTIDAKNEVPTELVTDEMPTLMIGDTVTIERLITQMITQSDNTAYNQLLDVLGRDNITSYAQSLGMTHTHIGSKLNLDDSQTQYEYDVPGYGINTTTADDYEKAFDLIKNNKIPGAKDLYEILKKQKIKYIAAYLPDNVVCGTKAGDLDPLYHDGGICQDGKRSYIETVFTNVGAPDLISHLSQIIYTGNFQLVGQSTANATISENIDQNHPIDPLVFTKPSQAVLGASTINFPVPEITAADLGITAKDLSLTMNANQLPASVIPPGSPFYFISDAWQLTKKAFVLGPVARRNVDIETAKLYLAGAQKLIQQGKTQQAQIVLANVQSQLNSLAKDPTIKTDITAQNTIQAISETRFSLLGNNLQKTTGNSKLLLIKEIATQAKATLQNVQPNIPQAVTATTLAQKPLLGTVISKTDTTATIKTAGGQIVSIPTTNNSIKIKNIQPTTSPSTPSQPLIVGTTVALVGSSINNKFTPTLVVANVPKELAAPEPVTVAKVNTKNNTMVVIENGVYTQVNINKNTNIKAADTNINLKSIHPGDVVVVHGQPLTVVHPIATPTQQPTKALASPTQMPTATQQKLNPSISGTLQQSGIKITSVPVQATTMPKQTGPVQGQKNIQTQPITTPASPQPKIIQSTSIQVVEKKEDVQKAIQTQSAPAPKPQSQPAQQTQSKPQQQSQSNPQPQSHPQQQSQPQQPAAPVTTNKNNTNKKK